MATQTRAPTSEVSVTGTWSGANRHLLLDDYPDSANPVADSTTCSAAGVAVFGFSAFSIPAESTAISVQVQYYDFKNGSSGSTIGGLIRCNDTTNRLASTHNPGNGNANIASRSDNYATNPKSAAAWTVDDVNGSGTNGLTAFGVSVTDANPTVTVSCIQLQVTYTPPITADLSKTLGAATISSAGKVIVDGDLAKTLGATTISATGVVTTTATGSLSKTLDAFTISAAGDVDIGGSLSKTLDAISISAAASAIIAGALSKTLGAISISASGTVADAGPSLSDGDDVQCVMSGGIECTVTIGSGTAVRVVTEGIKQISVIQAGGTPIRVTI